MFKIKVGKPTLRDLVEIQMDSRFNLYPVPFGEVNDLAEGNVYVVKRSVPWKGVKGEAYKKVTTRTGKNLFEAQHINSGLKTVRDALKAKAIRGVVLVQMNDGTYEIIPAFAAALSKNHPNKVKRKKRVAKVVDFFDTKDQALAYAKAMGYIGKAAVPTPKPRVELTIAPS